MVDNSDRVGVYLVAGLVLGALIMAIAHGLPNWDWSAERWFGQKPILDYATSALAPLVAGFAGVVALRTFRLNLQSGIAARFQKGVELLTDGSPTAHTAGLEIILDVCRLEPKAYLTPVIRTLTIHVTDLSNDGWSLVNNNKWTISGQSPTITTYRTIAYINSIITAGVKAGFGNSKFVYLYRPYLHHVSYKERRTWTRFVFQTLAVGKVDFNNATFDKCKFIDVDIANKLIFTNCTFRDVQFSRVGSKKIEFKNCQYENTSFAGKPLTADGAY